MAGSNASISLPAEFFTNGKTIKIECVGYFSCSNGFNDDQAIINVYYNSTLILSTGKFNLAPAEFNKLYSWKLEVWMTQKELDGCSSINTFNANGMFSWTTVVAGGPEYGVGLIALVDTIQTTVSSNDIYPTWTWTNTSTSDCVVTNQACTVMN